MLSAKQRGSGSQFCAGWVQTHNLSLSLALPLSHWFLEYFGFKVHILYLLVFYSGCCRLCRSNFTGGKNTVSDVLIHFDYYAFYILLFSLFLFLFFYRVAKPLPCGGWRQLFSTGQLTISFHHSQTNKQTHKKEM